MKQDRDTGRAARARGPVARYGAARVLIRQMERNGHRLFRYRNHLPLVLIPLLAVAMGQSEGLERRYGDGLETAWESLCVAIMLAGLTVRCLVVGYCPPGTSGRNSRAQHAGSLNTRGMYSVVRHPLYLGNLLITIGAITMIEVWWLAVVVALAFALYYERIIIAEEAFLEARFGDHFREWAAHTPAFVPTVQRWRTPRRPFSLRKVLANESPTFAQIVVAVTVIDLACDWTVWRRLDESDLILGGFAACSVVAYFALRAVRKKTRWLSARR
jgi:protein-S-isoprenylcysteine O-methyltransferase Ste14